MKNLILALLALTLSNSTPNLHAGDPEPNLEDGGPKFLCLLQGKLFAAQTEIEVEQKAAAVCTVSVRKTRHHCVGDPILRGNPVNCEDPGDPEDYSLCIN